MKHLLKIIATTCVAAVGIFFVGSCDRSSGNKEASMVNIEKGVASPMATPEAPGMADLNAEQPVGIIGADTEATEAVDQAEKEVESEKSTPEGETANDAGE